MKLLEKKISKLNDIFDKVLELISKHKTEIETLEKKVLNLEYIKIQGTGLASS